MASALKRGSVWYAKFKDHTGQLVRRATSTQNRRECERLAFDLEEKAERQRLGLEVRPVETDKTLGDVCQWWLENKCPEPSRQIQNYQLGAHFVRSDIGTTQIRFVTADLIDTYFDDIKRKGAAPGTINKLRGTLLQVFEAAKKKQWVAHNPIEAVETHEIPPAEHETLRVHEVPGFLMVVNDEWRNFFATAIYLALRKGELVGLLKTSLDWEQLTIRVSHSYDQPTTKGNKHSTLPIPKPLVPFLRDAVARSKSKWVFPSANGEMRTRECDPQKILRTALCQTGLIEGYEHGCRRCKAHAVKSHRAAHPDCKDAECPKLGRGHVELHPDNDERRCPACKMLLWPKAIPRSMVFHDLRHTTATLLLRAKVPWPHIQKIMRHASIKTTLGTYGHLDVEDIRESMEQVAPLSEVQQQQLAAVSFSNSNTSGVHMNDARGTDGQRYQQTASISAHLMSGSCWDRTSDPYRVKVGAHVGRDAAIARKRGKALHKPGVVGSPTTPGEATRGNGSGPVQVQPPRRLRAVADVLPSLLTVKEVAERLKLAVDTVYRLVASGALPHFRVLSMVRIREEDLQDFIQRGDQ